MKYAYYDYTIDISSIIGQIQKSGKKYDLVVGIQKGGLIPAVHIANVLDIPFASLQWSTKGVREGSNQHLICNKDKNVLLVDDILDSGDTIQQIQERYWQMDTAVLIYNTVNRWNLVPTYYGWNINRDNMLDWVDFWWETV